MSDAKVKAIYKGLGDTAEKVLDEDFNDRIRDLKPGQFIETPKDLEFERIGVKYDQDKPRMGLVLGGFKNALAEVAKVGTAGAKKYTDNGWLEVEDGEARYTDAMFRHALADEEIDPDFGLLHAAHVAWNSLAVLELKLKGTKK